MVSMLRLSHSVHFAACTFTRVICAGSDEQVRRLPLGVRATGLARTTPGVRTEGLLSKLFGVRGGAGVRGVVGVMEIFEALGVAGGAMGLCVETARGGGDGVFASEDIVGVVSFGYDVSQCPNLGRRMCKVW
jgi:hypothetical protein